MPLHIIYNPADGKMVSQTGSADNVDFDAVTAKGLAVKVFNSIDAPNVPRNKKWNESTMDLDDFTPPTIVRIDTLMNRLTDDELDTMLGIRNDKATTAFLERIKHIRSIDANDTKVNALFDFFISQGIITAQRKGELLAEDRGA